MRICLVAMSAAAVVVTASTALAACGPPLLAPAAVCTPLSPFGYGFEVADARRDLYIANRGPVYEGPNVFTYPPPFYFESGYAYARPYPYVHFYTLAHGRRLYRAARWQHRHAY